MWLLDERILKNGKTPAINFKVTYIFKYVIRNITKASETTSYFNQVAKEPVWWITDSQQLIMFQNSLTSQ